MAKNNALVKVTVMAPSSQQDAGRYISKKQIDQFLVSSKIKEKDIQWFREDMMGLASAVLINRTSELAIGKHLASMDERIKRDGKAYRGILPKIMAGFGIRVREGYRLIGAFNNAQDAFQSEHILKAAMVQGLDIKSYDPKKPLGKYTQVVHALPPPRNPDPEAANRYVAQLKQTYAERRKAMKAKGKKDDSADIEHSPEFLLEREYRGIKNALEEIPTRKRQRWFEQLVGMSLTKMGIASPMTFHPEAIPEELDRGRGRPADKEEVPAA